MAARFLRGDGHPHGDQAVNGPEAARKAEKTDDRGQAGTQRAQGVAWRVRFSPQATIVWLRIKSDGGGYEESASGLVRLGFLLSLVSLAHVLRLKAMAAMCA